jgi:hypothetical protein
MAGARSHRSYFSVSGTLVSSRIGCRAILKAISFGLNILTIGEMDANVVDLTRESVFGFCSATKQEPLPVEASSVPHANKAWKLQR